MQQNDSDKPQTTESQTKETTNDDVVAQQQQQLQQQSPENEISDPTTTTKNEEAMNAKPSLKIKRKNTGAIKEQDKMEKELLNQQVFQEFKKFLELEFASESK